MALTIKLIYKGTKVKKIYKKKPTGIAGGSSYTGVALGY